MTDFSEHKDVLIALEKSQSDDSDMRDQARESHLFVDKRDGQWEPYWWNQMINQPRYTFDMVTPIIDLVAGEMEQADFSVRVKPAGGNTTKNDAKVLDGLIRNIENISNAKDIYNRAGRNMITSGIDGWQIKQKFVDDDSFFQDLMIEPIANFIDSVWFGPFKKPDASDSKWCVVLEAIDKAEYDERWPEGSGQSVGDGRYATAYYTKSDDIVIAQIYYIEEEPRNLLLMSSGRVLEETKDVKMILDELAQQGEVVKDKRTRNKNIVKSRLFDGKGWLNKEQKTVFNQIPVIPVLANFKIFENKILYYGIVLKRIDAQQVFNYAKSREISEGALAPREKVWATEKQTAGHEDTLATLNTNADPVQHYTPDPAAPGPPMKQPGPQVNAGLKVLSDDMNSIITQTAGLFAANLGDNPGLQSGVAIKQLQNKGDIGTIKFFNPMERAIGHTCRILVDAIPVVYDTPRQVRILKEDGSFDMTTLNEPVQDQQTGRMITANDMSKGKYDVTCSLGPAFQNRQEETVSAIIEMGGVDPSIIEMGGDILFNNINSPGMDLIAERKRVQLYQGGLIPFEQQTEEEQQQTQQAQQNPQQPDPNMVLAQAEASKAKAQGDKVIVDMQIAQSKEQRENFKVQLEAQDQKFNQMIAMNESMVEKLNLLSEALKFIRAGLPEGGQILDAQTQIISGVQGNTMGN